MFNRDAGEVRSCLLGVMDLSDHSSVYLNLEVNEDRVLSLWRLNTTLLKGQIKEEMDKKIQEIVTMEKFSQLCYGIPVSPFLVAKL